MSFWFAHFLMADGVVRPRLPCLGADKRRLPLQIGCTHGMREQSPPRRKTDVRLKALTGPDIKGHLKSRHCLICHGDECVTWARPSVKH